MRIYTLCTGDIGIYLLLHDHIWPDGRRIDIATSHITQTGEPIRRGHQYATQGRDSPQHYQLQLDTMALNRVLHHLKEENKGSANGGV